MNKKQRIALWIGVALIVLTGLFPPWCAVSPKFEIPLG